MPDAAPLGGSHQLSTATRPAGAPALRFQVLRVSFEISADDASVRQKLRFLNQSAGQPEPPVSTVHYDVSQGQDGYEISRNDELADVQFDATGVLDSLYRRIQHDALEAWPGAPVLEAMTGSYGGERFLIVGDSLKQRSQVGLALIAHGADVEGDDLAILHDGELTAYPRPLRICGTHVPLPPSAPSREELPFVGSNPVTGSWVLDLTQAGIDWQITTGRPDTIIQLQTNYGGQTRLSDVPRHDMARILMSHCDPRGDAVGAVKAVAELANRARRCARLWLGSLEHVDSIWP